MRETLVRIKSANNLRRGASDKKTLEEAKIKFADVFVAATGNDSENIVACELAKLHKSQIRIRMKKRYFLQQQAVWDNPRGEKWRTRTNSWGRIWPLLLRFSGPSIISATVTATYNLVDAIFAGCLGLEALAALAVAFPLMIIYTSVGFCVGFGSSSLISRNLGARRRRAADVAVGNAIFLFLLISIIATLVFYLSLEPLLRLFGATGEVLDWQCPT